MQSLTHNTATTRGRFISFEGLDGCGKSTQLRALENALRALGIAAVSTREPGGTLLGEQVRTLLLDGKEQNIDGKAELALLFAARTQLVAEIIQPALASGTWVLCDRFVDSSEAYQGSGRGLGVPVVHTMHRVLNGGLMPDLTLILRGSVDLSLARARARGVHKRADRFEREEEAFFERVQEGFDGIAARDSERVVTLDASQTKQTIHERLLAIVVARFNLQTTSEATRAAQPLMQA